MRIKKCDLKRIGCEVVEWSFLGAPLKAAVISLKAKNFLIN
jgi:hypothetical protein